MNAYQVLAFASNSQYYALWLSRTNQYLKSYDEDFSGLIYAESAEKLKPHLQQVVTWLGRWWQSWAMRREGNCAMVTAISSTTVHNLMACS